MELMLLNKISIRIKDLPWNLFNRKIWTVWLLGMAAFFLFVCTVQPEGNGKPTQLVPLTPTLHLEPSRAMPYIVPTNTAPPEYVLGFHPAGPMSFSDYQNSLSFLGVVNRGVGIGLSISNEDWEAKQSISLSLDGIIVTDETFLYSIAGYTHYYFSWAPEIQPGLHEAHFELVTAEGDYLEYTWYFSLIEP